MRGCFTLQVAQQRYDQLPDYGAAARAPLLLSRSEQERLLRRLELMNLLKQETARQETYQAITSVIRVDPVRRLRLLGSIWHGLCISSLGMMLSLWYAH